MSRHNETWRQAVVASNKARVWTPEMKDKWRAKMVGRKQTPEHIAKVKAAVAAMGPRVVSEEVRAKLRAANLGKKHSEETRRKIGLAQVGGHKNLGRKRARWEIESGAAKRRHPLSPEALEANRRGHLLLVGAGSHLWRGGKTIGGRQDSRVYPWKLAVHKRDHNTCQWCGETDLHGPNRHADHIFAWAEVPEWRFEVWNGRTLCRACHSVRSMAQSMRRARNTA